MTYEYQRYVIVNFIKNNGNSSKPEYMSIETIERLLERGLILDPMISRDGVHAALVLLNRGQRVAFGRELHRQLYIRQALRTASPVCDTEVFDCLHAPAGTLCKVLLKVIGKWDPKL